MRRPERMSLRRRRDDSTKLPPRKLARSSDDDRILQRRTPNSFALDSYVKKKGQGYECLYCRKDITKTMQFHCVECKDDKGFVLCVLCFWEGKEMPPHKKSHRYRINFNKPKYYPFESGWTAHHEIQMLQAIYRFGIGNWKCIAECVGFSKPKCQKHYNTHYLDVINCVDNAESASNADAGDASCGVPALPAANTSATSSHDQLAITADTTSAVTPSTTGAVSSTTGAVSGTTGAVSGTTGAVSGTTGAVSGTTGAVSGTTGAVSGTTGAVSGTTGAVLGVFKRTSSGSPGGGNKKSPRSKRHKGKSVDVNEMQAPLSMHGFMPKRRSFEVHYLDDVEYNLADMEFTGDETDLEIEQKLHVLKHYCKTTTKRDAFRDIILDKRVLDLNLWSQRSMEWTKADMRVHSQLAPFERFASSNLEMEKLREGLVAARRLESQLLSQMHRVLNSTSTPSIRS